MRRQCIKHEWLANLLMIAGSLLFAGSVIVFILYQQSILHWVGQNPLFNPMLLGAAVIAEVGVFFLISRVVFADCGQEAEQHQGIYHGRKSVPVSGDFIHSMAMNPKRRQRESE